jgi:hypothetical protein
MGTIGSIGGNNQADRQSKILPDQQASLRKSPMASETNRMLDNLDQKDDFTKSIPENRELNRNDLMKAFRPQAQAAPQPEQMDQMTASAMQSAMQTQQNMNQHFIENMSNEEAGQVLDDFASDAAEHHFEERGIDPTDKQTAKYEQQVKNDVTTLAAHKNGEAEPEMDSQKEVGERVKGYMLDASNHQVKENAQNAGGPSKVAPPNPEMSPMTTAHNSSMLQQRVMAAGDKLHASTE